MVSREVSPLSVPRRSQRSLRRALPFDLHASAGQSVTSKPAASGSIRVALIGLALSLHLETRSRSRRSRAVSGEMSDMDSTWSA